MVSSIQTQNALTSVSVLKIKVFRD